MLRYQIVPVTPFEQNCSILWCDVRAARRPWWIRAATPSASSRRPTPLASSIELILLTHGHIDHAGGTAGACPPAGRSHRGAGERKTAFWIDDLPKQSKMFGFPTSRLSRPTAGWWTAMSSASGRKPCRAFIAPATRRDMWCSSAKRRGWRWWVMCFLPAPSAARISRGAITRTLINSIRQKLWPLGKDVSFIPGHGPMSTFGDERESNPYVGDYA
jgi:hydroxyacylglutathione hydrolase